MRAGLLAFAAAGLTITLAWARSSLADCTVDTDCPGPACGDAVCQWTVGGHNCVSAGTDVEGFDGECSADVNCKCATMGATCSAATGHCTFTVPQSTADASTTATTGSGTGGQSMQTTPSCTASACPSRASSGAFPAVGVALGGLGCLAMARRRRRRR